MKPNYLLLAATILFSHSAFAQSSTSAVMPAEPATSVAPASSDSSSATNSSAANAALPSAANADVTKPAIKYFGYVHGAGMDFSGAHQAGINNDSQMRYEQRVKLLPISNKKVDFGVEARINTDFADGKNWNTSNGNWRLHTNFKNVLNNDVYNLSLMPRLVLPTSKTMHNQKTTFSPDFIAELGITPKNSRFSFDSGIEYIRYFHMGGASATDYAAADENIFAPWVEADYQLTPKTQLMLSYWPAFVNQRGTDITSSFAQDGCNEIAGAYYEFVKGWQVNPFVAIEPSNMGQHAAVTRNLQANLLIIGQIL